MRGVSTPTHEYARVAGLYLQAICCGPNDPPCDSSLFDSVEHLTASARAYTRVILRLRAQAESEFNARALISPEQAANRTYNAPLLTMKQNNSNPPQAWSNGSSHGSIRAPSPALSLYSHSLHGHPSNMNLNSNPTSRVPRALSSRHRRRVEDSVHHCSDYGEHRCCVFLYHRRVGIGYQTRVWCNVKRN